MSRVYNVLTGAARPAPPPVAAIPDDGVWENTEDTENSEETPFIEIGGPKGPIFFSPPAASLAAAIPAIVPTPVPTPRVVPEAKADPAREFPRLVPATAAPAYLSVRFHEIARAPGKTGDGPDPSLVALHFPEHAVSGEYRVLRDEIRKQLPEPTPRVLLFAAANPEAGTTTVLLNLAVTLAHDGKTKVLVADANVHRPRPPRGSPSSPRRAVRGSRGAGPLAWAARRPRCRRCKCSRPATPPTRPPPRWAATSRNCSANSGSGSTGYWWTRVCGAICPSATRPVPRPTRSTS